MTSPGRPFVGRISTGNERKNDLTIIMDASGLIQMAALINPQHVSERSWDPDPSLLSFLEHLGKLGVRIIIPESVIFEAIGHRANGKQLNRKYEDKLDYRHLEFFLRHLREKKIENIRVVSTPFANMHLTELEERQHDYDAFNKYRLEHMIGFGDRDIIQMLEKSTYHGNAFVVTIDGELTDILAEARNKGGRTVGVIDALGLCEATQRVAPIEWLPHGAHLNELRSYINYHYTRDNQKRVSEGKEKIKGLNKMLGENDKGVCVVARGELQFDQALYNMLRAHERGR